MVWLRQGLDFQLGQLSRRHGARGIGHEIGPARHLREGDHFAQRFGLREEHHGPVESDGDSAVRRRAVTERVQEEAEFFARLFFAHSERLEDSRLYVRAVDSDRAAAQLGAVEDQVVGLGAHRTRIAFELVQVIVDRRGERVVHRVPSLVVFVVFEHREVDDPEQAVLALVDQFFDAAHFQPHLAERVADHVPLASDHQDRVTRFRAGGFDHGVDALGAERFRQGGFALAFQYLNVSQPARAVFLRVLDDVVEPFARPTGRPGNDDAFDRAAFLDGVGEDRERAALELRAQVYELQAEAQVGFVRAESVHRLGVGHSREGRRRRLDAGRFEKLDDQRLDRGEHVVRLDETHLDVYLGKFGLAVGAQVLVAEAPRDLEVAVVARNHQQLFEQLRRLRQREELAWEGARRHQVIARAFGRRFRQDRRLDLVKALRVERASRGQRQFVPQFEVALHLWTSQIEVAVLQPQVFSRLAIVYLERRSLRIVQDLQFRGEHFDLASHHVRIVILFGARDALAGDGQHIFRARLPGAIEQRGVDLFAEDELRDAVAVAEMNEKQRAMVAITV